MKIFSVLQKLFGLMLGGFFLWVKKGYEPRHPSYKQADDRSARIFLLYPALLLLKPTKTRRRWLFFITITEGIITLEQNPAFVSAGSTYLKDQLSTAGNYLSWAFDSELY